MDFPHHNASVLPTAGHTAAAACSGQFPQRPLRQLPQPGRVRKRPRDQPAIQNPAAEGVLAPPVLAINQLLWRDAYIGSIDIQQEHQPDQTRLRCRLELRLRI